MTQYPPWQSGQPNGQSSQSANQSRSRPEQVRQDQLAGPAWATNPFHTGAPGSPPPSIEDFAAPRPNRARWLWVTLATVVVLVTVGGLASGVIPLDRKPTPTPTATTAVSYGPGMPFLTSGGRSQGRWEIVESTWTSTQLILKVKVTADRNSVAFKFRAFEHETLRVVKPDLNTPNPSLVSGSLLEGQSRTGYVVYTLTRGDTTIVMVDDTDTQISALLVQG